MPHLLPRNEIKPEWQGDFCYFLGQDNAGYFDKCGRLDEMDKELKSFHNPHVKLLALFEGLSLNGIGKMIDETQRQMTLIKQKKSTEMDLDLLNNIVRNRWRE